VKIDQINSDENIVLENMDSLNSSQKISQKTYTDVIKSVKKDNITPENIGEILLCQIPGFSASTARAVLTKFDGSFPKLMSAINDKEAEGLFKDIVLESGNGKVRKISKTCISNLFKFLQ